jgi:pimeloyl-ACP methyl ester carboxylesterase
MAGGETMISSASELRAFNAGMRSVENTLYVRVPDCVLWGDLDQTAIRTWHLPWLQSRVHDLKYVVVQRAAHLVHYDAPITVLSKIVEYSGRGKLPNSDAPGHVTSDQTYQIRW